MFRSEIKFQNKIMAKNQINNNGIVRVAIKDNYSNYIIYSDGRVYNQRTGIYLNSKPMKKNTVFKYLAVTLRSDKGERRTFLLHRLVWETFIGAIPQGKQINHIDENRENNTLFFDKNGQHIGGNLELVTPLENCNHGTRNAKISAACKGLKRCKQSFMVEVEGQQDAKIYNSLKEMCDACGQKRTTWNYRIYKNAVPKSFFTDVLPDGRLMKITILTPEHKNRIEQYKKGE